MIRSGSSGIREFGPDTYQHFDALMHSEQPPVIFSPTQALLILAFVFIVPVLLLNPVFDVSRTLAMLFEALGLGFLLGKSTDDESYNFDNRRDKRKKIIRSRTESLSTSEGNMAFVDLLGLLTE